MNNTLHEDVDSWDAVRRFLADVLDKNCFRAARTVAWSQIACCMAIENLLLESGFEEMTPPMLVELAEDGRPREHADLMMEMHSIRCLSVTEYIDFGAAPEAQMVDSENQRATALEVLHKGYKSAVCEPAEEGADVDFGEVGSEVSLRNDVLANIS